MKCLSCQNKTNRIYAPSADLILACGTPYPTLSYINSFRDLERLTDALSAKLKDVAIEAYRVNDDDGTINRELTDIAAAEAVSDGRVQLSKEFFELMQKELPPSDKTVICEGLEAFEARVKRINA